MTPYTVPTAAQIAQAQAAGDAAYTEAERNDAPLATRYDAYRAAYEAERDRQETDDAPRPGYIAKSTTTLPEAQAAAEEKHAQYRDWQHGERGQGCAGNSADEYDSSTEGHW